MDRLARPAGVDPDPAEILADVETAIRRCVPFPHRAPRIHDVDSLLELIAAAEHVDYAEHALAQHTPLPTAQCGPNTTRHGS